MLLSIVPMLCRRSVESGFRSAAPGHALGLEGRAAYNFYFCPLPLEDVWTSAEFP
jgi:hypothetical protein